MITPRFLDVLRVEEVSATHWRLLAELRYDSAVLGARLIIPAGFETNFASVPRAPFAFWLAGDVGRKAAVVHDFCYSSHVARERYLADSVFYEALRAEGVSAVTAWLMYVAVRWGGGSRW
jgi:hypothetical protein